jgi:hypothetical protein
LRVMILWLWLWLCHVLPAALQHKPSTVTYNSCGSSSSGGRGSSSSSGNSTGVHCLLNTVRWKLTVCTQICWPATAAAPAANLPFKPPPPTPTQKKGGICWTAMAHTACWSPAQTLHSHLQSLQPYDPVKPWCIRLYCDPTVCIRSRAQVAACCVHEHGCPGVPRGPCGHDCVRTFLGQLLLPIVPSGLPLRSVRWLWHVPPAALQYNSPPPPL